MHSFTIKVNANISTLLDQVKDAITAADGYFSGDAFNGDFSVSGVVGSYHVHGDVVTVNILKKPLLVPHVLIERKVRSYFTK